MDIQTALLIIAGVITEDNVDWEFTGYDTYKLRLYGCPAWNDVKRKAVEVIAERMRELETIISERNGQ